MKYPLIVFDWDGTLMDSEARIVASMQSAASDVNLPVPPTESVRDIIGLGLAEALQQLFPGLKAETCDRLTERYRDYFLFRSPVPTQLFDGVFDMLNELKERGYLLAVATGKGRRGLDRVLTETQTRDYFSCTRCADETRSKPHPLMLQEIMRELNVTPGQTLMVGDTEYDMDMARQANASALAVSYGVHCRERLMKYRPHACINEIAELLPTLDALATLDQHG
jgi:phosphoglycolate phosphatase